MPLPPPVTPVQRSSFTSHDEAEITEFIRATYADNASRFAPIVDGARFSARTNDTPAIGADRVSTSIDYDGTSEEGFSDYVFFVVHAGSVAIDSPGQSTTAGPRGCAFYPLGVPVAFTMHGFDVTTVRLSARRLERSVEALTAMPAAHLRFSGLTPVSASMDRYWRSVVGLVSGALMDPNSPLDSALLAEDLARTVATAALHTFPNTTMTLQHEPGPGSVAPAAIRRAVAYVDAHAHTPVQVDDIATAAGTSVRALQYGFHQHLGTTPSGYVRRVRLEGAHRELQAADPVNGDSVAAIASRWGFGHPGRFAAAYRQTYGVLPAATLRT